MTHNEIIDKLAEIRPGARYTLRGTRDGTTYEGLEWLDPVQVKPTREELGL